MFHLRGFVGVFWTALYGVVLLESSICWAQAYSFPSSLKSETQTRYVAQYKNFVQMIRFAAGGDAVKVIRSERENASSDEWYDMKGEYSISGSILDVGSMNGGDTLFVAMMDDTGDLVIERWDFVVRTGHWIHTAPASGGQTYQGITSIKGGVFEAPAGGAHVSPQRRVLFRGGGVVHELRAMVADPEGRFLLMYEDHPAGKLWKLDLTGASSGTPSVLYDQLTAPELVETRDMQAYDHQTMGRVHVCTEVRGDTHASPTKHVLLLDETNDGTVDSKLNVPASEWNLNVQQGESMIMWKPIYKAGVDLGAL